MIPRDGGGQVIVNDPIPVVLYCPVCKTQHIDAPNPTVGWTNPPHRSHYCLNCACVWRPADVATTGVARVETRGTVDTWPVPEGL